MFSLSHTKDFGIYHWDTFDNETLLVGEALTLDNAIAIIHEKYKGKIINETHS